MIRKVIHTIWLSGEPRDRFTTECMETWKKVMPDYEIKEWTARDFNRHALPCFVREAINLRKWAFASDYLRLFVLYHEGGIYLDSDVCLIRSLDKFNTNRFYSFMEYHPKAAAESKTLLDNSGTALTAGHIPGICIQAAVMGAEKGHPFLKTCMEYYEDHHFINEDGTLQNKMLAPDIYALCARQYGYRYQDKEQNLDNDIRIYPSDWIAGSPLEIRTGSFGIHACLGSWREQTALEKIKRFILKSRIRYYMRHIN